MAVLVLVVLVVIVAAVGLQEWGQTGATQVDSQSPSAEGGAGTTASATGDSGVTDTPATSAGTGLTDVLPTGTRWILVLRSIEKTEPLSAARNWAASFTSDPRVLVIDSDRYPRLRPGYWVVVSHGYASEDHARGDCELSFAVPPGGDCYPRQVA